MSEYKPVECAAHSLYELAVMKRQMTVVRWQDDSGSHSATLLPIDVVTENSEEFLVVVKKEGEEPFRIRLDHILAFEQLT